MMNNNPVLSVRNLHIAFGAVPVVHGLNFEIEAGKTLALVGESGSGKSVTSLAIMGLFPENVGKATGSIRLGDIELLGLSEGQMRSIRGSQISMIFQEPMTSLNPVQRIGDQLAEAIRLHRGLKGTALREAVLEMLRKVRIPDPETRMRQYPHTFSGGMRQRIMIAMALACNPKLIIADEPTTALDVTVQAQILDLLRELQRETGTAILFITHDMGVVAEMADDVLVIQKGQVIERGEVHEIFSNPKEDYTRTLIAATPSLVDCSVKLSKPLEMLPELPLTETALDTKDGPVILVDNLCVRFPVRSGLFSRLTGNVHAVENVSFAIRKGETLGLVGESGSGKSTIGKAIIGLAPVHSGRIHLFGREIDYENSGSQLSLHRDVQMVFQDPFGSLNARQTIGSAIMEPMTVHRLAQRKEAREKMHWLLERVGLDPRRAGSLPHEFSGGQRQRICIARALAMSPRLIIADEAVSALDVAIKGQIIELMIDLQQEFGVSYLFISHDMAAVERICDRVAVMYFGEIVEIGAKKDVIANPIHPYTQRLLSAIPVSHPAQRKERLVTAADKEKPYSPLKPLGYKAPLSRWARASDGHYIQQSAQRNRMRVGRLFNAYHQ